MSDTVMVTGGAGFIGARLVPRLLDDGLEVHVFDVTPRDRALRLKPVLDHPGLVYVEGDIRDREALRRFYRPEATHLYHLASVVGVRYYMENPLALVDAVVGGTRELLELARAHGTRVLFTSTSEIYGRNPATPWNEEADRVLGPTSVDRWSYSSSKAVCEHMLYALYRSDDLPFSTVRFFNVYGPGQAPIFVVSQSIHKAMRGEAPLLYDSGRQTRCFTYVDDAIEGVVRASRSAQAVGEAFNIGADVETSIGEIVNTILDATGNAVTPEAFDTGKQYGRVYEDIPRRIPDVSKAERLLGWTARTPVDQGIRRTIDWVRDNAWWLA